MLKERTTKDSLLHDELSECIAACFGCILTCNRCSESLVRMESHGNARLRDQCIRLCRDAAELCTVTASWLSRNSGWSPQACRLCAEICEGCAECCEHYAPHHALCGVCANECRRCAELCKLVADHSAREEGA
jgi:hypothetical protein